MKEEEEGVEEEERRRNGQAKWIQMQHITVIKQMRFHILTKLNTDHLMWKSCK